MQKKSKTSEGQVKIQQLVEDMSRSYLKGLVGDAIEVTILFTDENPVKYMTLVRSFGNSLSRKRKTREKKWKVNHGCISQEIRNIINGKIE